MEKINSYSNIFFVLLGLYWKIHANQAVVIFRFFGVPV